MAAVLTVTGLVGVAAPAQAANDTSVSHCGDTIARQSDNGVTAGGGPKAGIPAPTNCDHFFQLIGVIGSGN
jgi:hypothetical protein